MSTGRQLDCPLRRCGANESRILGPEPSRPLPLFSVFPPVLGEGGGDAPGLDPGAHHTLLQLQA